MYTTRTAGSVEPLVGRGKHGRHPVQARAVWLSTGSALTLTLALCLCLAWSRGWVDWAVDFEGDCTVVDLPEPRVDATKNKKRNPVCP